MRTLILLLLISISSYSQTIGEKFIIYKPSTSIDSKFTYLKALQKGVDKEYKPTWDNFNELNVVYSDQIINTDFEIVKVNEDGSIIAANTSLVKVGEKEEPFETRYIVKDYKKAIESKEIVLKEVFSNLLSTDYPKSVSKLLAHDHWVGMSADELYISKGKPSSIATKTDATGTTLEYTYKKPKAVFTIKNNKVTSFQLN
jgi:hypothetical protein